MGDQTKTTNDNRSPNPGNAADSELIDRYEKLVYKVAHRLHQNLPDTVDIEDLIGWGYTGLLEAHHRYDETKSTRFSTYAYYRIRGAMLDACQQLGVDPNQQLAEVSGNEILNTYAHVVHAHRGQAGLEDRLAALSDVAGSMAMVFVLRDCPSKALRPDGAPHKQALERRQSAEKVRELVKALPEVEQRILEAVYFEGKTLTRVGEEMEYSPSWVSRIHSRALDRLRRQIEREEDLQDLCHAMPV